MLRWQRPKDRLTGKKVSKPALELTSRLEIARTLHERLNKAIANRDEAAIKEIACAGLAAKIRSNFDREKQLRKAKVDWDIQGYIGLRPPTWIPYPFSSLIPNRAIKVKSELITPVPLGGRQITWRQTVVQIKSTQKWNRNDYTGLRVKDFQENVVIQKLTGEGREGKWMIWGTLPNSKKEDFETVLEEEEIAGGGYMERMKAAMSGSGSGSSGASFS